ncbi:MAG: LCP family protein [Oscillospiraceae bacterium]|nr:LCP family protein [Oscillospiraceae bacterium]MDY6207289.1 LCP family protein [Oscillospiraceae bacterium]
MSKRSAKIAATYFLTIIMSLLLIGGGGYLFITKYLEKEPETDGMDDIVMQDSSAQNAEYAPVFGDGRTVLFIYEAEKSQTSTSFLLARFAPADNKAVLVPLQTDIACELNGTANTLYEFYRLGGTTEAKKAVEKFTGLTVDKYLKFSKDSFTLFSDFMGNVDYDIPYNLIIENPSTGESTVIKSGNQLLDSNTLRKVMCYPDYNGGEEYRAKVVGNLAAELLNSGCRGILRDGLDTVFTDIINSDIETDITKYDYEEDKPAINYVLENTSAPAQLVIPSGSYNENGCYQLDEAFVDALPRWFAME